MWKISKFEKKKAFTLIEIMVSIGVMALLSVGLYSLIGQGPRQAARDGRRRSDLEQIKAALTVYRNDNGTYPGCVGGGNNCNVTLVFTSGGLPTFASYMTNGIPADVAPRVYTYAPRPLACGASAASRCTSFELCSASEKGGTVHTCGSGGTTTCGGSNSCVFWVTNE